MPLSVGHPRGTHSRYVIGFCLIPLETCGVENNSRRITYGIGCEWGMPSLSPYPFLVHTYFLGLLRKNPNTGYKKRKQRAEEKENVKFAERLEILPPGSPKGVIDHQEQ